MKNFILLIIVIGAIITLTAYCVPKKKVEWRGIFYPAGDILNDQIAQASPVYKSFEECKKWTKERQASTKNADARAVCTLNCKNPNDFTVLEDCEEVIRSWKMFPTSIQIDEYKPKSN